MAVTDPAGYAGGDVVYADSATVRVTWTREAHWGGGHTSFQNAEGELGSTTVPSSPVATADIEITFPEDNKGTVIYLIAANSATATDDGEVGPLLGLATRIDYDTRSPDVMISRAPGATDPATGAHEVLTFRFFRKDASQRDGTADVKVKGFANADVEIAFQNNKAVTPRAGLSAITMAPAPSYDATLTFPSDSQGVAVVAVKPHSVTINSDSTKTGPPGLRGIVIPYITDGTSLTTLSAAGVTISTPGSSWSTAIYVVEIEWTRDVTGFTVDDVVVTGATKGDLTQDRDDSTLYRLPVTMSGRGTVTVTIAAGVAEATGVPSPSNAVTVSFPYDITAGVLTVTGTHTALCEETFTFDNHSWLGTRVGGAFLGVSDLRVSDGRLYGVAQIQRKADGGAALSEVSPSGGALFSVSTGGGTCSHHKRYSYFTQAARSLRVHESVLYFFEGSHYIYEVPPPNQNLWENAIGYLAKIAGSGGVPVGLNWRSRFPISQATRFDGIHGGTASPLVSAPNGLHMVTGWGQFSNLGTSVPTTATKDIRDANPITDFRNLQWVVFDEALNTRLDVLATNTKTGFEILQELAAVTNSVLGFRKGQFIFKPRLATAGELGAAATDSEMIFQVGNLNRALPSSGMLLVGEELVTYAAKTVTTVTGVERAVHGTSASAPGIGTQFYLIDHVLDASAFEQPMNELSRRADTDSLYNHIKINYGGIDAQAPETLQVSREDSVSVEANGEKVLEVTVALGKHQGAWAEHLAETYLESYGKIKYLLDMELQASFYLKLGDILAVREPQQTELVVAAQIMRISHDYRNGTTRVVARTL